MENKTKVITLWSPTPGVGVSFTAINLAKALIKKGLKVALFDYDLAAPSLHLYLKMEDNVHCIDNVIPFTAGGNLTPKVLESNLQEIDGISILRGTNSPDQAQYIKIESLSQIIEISENMFDYIIIDTQSTVDNAGTYVALDKADKVFVITEKNVIGIQRYDTVRNLLTTNFSIEKFQLIINKCHKNIYMEKQDVENYFGLHNAIEIPMLDFEFINAINQGRWAAYISGNTKRVKSYANSIEKLITGCIDTDFTNKKDIEKSGFSFFKKK